MLEEKAQRQIPELFVFIVLKPLGQIQRALE